MPSYDDSDHPLRHLTRKFCIIARKWIWNRVVRLPLNLIGIPERISLPELSVEETSPSISMEAIEISSSDSESDLEIEYIDTVQAAPGQSVTYRRLPDSWSASSSIVVKDSDRSFKKQPAHPISVLDPRSNGRVLQEKNSQTGFQARVLPATLYGGSQIYSGYDHITDRFPGTIPVDHNLYGRNELGREKNDGAVIYDTVGTRRLLPPSLNHGKSVIKTPIVGSSDAANSSGVGEERPMEYDERIIYQAALQDLSQPKIEVDLPDGLLSVSLLRHQKIALAWMLQKETASMHCLGGILADDQGLGKTISMIALIQFQRPLQAQSTSNNSCHIESEALNLDEDDDIISLDEKVSQNGGSQNSTRTQTTSTVSPSFHKGKVPAGTLVVCPASVLRQWARELDEKVSRRSKLKVLVYHGNRTKDPVELAKYDVVLTTYSIVTNEVPKQPLVDDDEKESRLGDRYGLSSEFANNKKRKSTSNAIKKGKKGKKGIGGLPFDDSGPLARVAWFRVILDEAQTIKNHRTQVARACCGLRAKRRWCLSGTPIQNAIDDLYSYFRFLKYDPYCVYKSFCCSIKNPISRNSHSGYLKLQAVLKTIMLRRTKDTLLDGEPIIKLPPKLVNLKKVDFSYEERAFYSRLEAHSRSQFKEYAAAGTVKQNYASILTMLLRLRQACDHPLLVKGYQSDSAGVRSLEAARKLPRQILTNLLSCLEASSAICGICSDPPDDAVVTMCGHVFCYQCVLEHLTGDDHLCPADNCKEQISKDALFSGATLRRCSSDDMDNNGESSSGLDEESWRGETSSKIKAALDILHSLSKSRSPSSNGNSIEHYFSDVQTNLETDNSNSELLPEHPDKAIIFSQWTGMLDILEHSLSNSGLQYRRLDGTMSLASRDKAVKDFTTNPEVTVMIMSLKAGNLGLNMVAASHVILLDLWWNPTTEDQAVDRAHRIGQTRPVTVSRLTVKNTVEDRILALQEEKRKMVSSAFGEDKSGSFATRLTVEDLQYLFMV